ncbi:MAG: hypothetical protein FJY54_16830 [Betaproteobacteria bacterium]|nr:hypothetical protein [Betaproteobacteria bacterium]
MNRGHYARLHGRIPFIGAPALRSGTPPDGYTLFLAGVASHGINPNLRALAMTGAQRSAAIPDIPAVTEAGVAGYETGSWYGIVAPARTPRPVVEQLGREIAAVVKASDISGRLASEAVIPIGGTPDDFDAHIKRELAPWAKVAKQAKIELE